MSGYSNKANTENGNIITFSDTTNDESIFYQPNDFIGYSHIQGMYPKVKGNWNEKVFLFIVCVFRKAVKGEFDYSNKFNRKYANKTKIKLPFKNNEIDWEYMENKTDLLLKEAKRNIQKFK